MQAQITPRFHKIVQANGKTSPAIASSADGVVILGNLVEVNGEHIPSEVERKTPLLERNVR